MDEVFYLRAMGDMTFAQVGSVMGYFPLDDWKTLEETH